MEYALLYDHTDDTFAVIQRGYGDHAWVYYQSDLRKEVAEALLKGLTS